MRNRTVTARMFTAVAAATLTIGVVVPVSTVPAWAANGPDSWRNGFPPASQIDASLGAYGTAPEVTAEKFAGRWYVCDNLQARPTVGIATAVYDTTPPTRNGVRDDARVYSSASSAKAAFKAIKARLKSCVGSVTKVGEPGSGQKWISTTSVGDVPSVTVDGNSSLFVYERQALAKGSTLKKGQLGSSYSVLTLVGDAILVSDATVAGTGSMSTSQRDAVASWADAFVTSWSAANG